MKEKIRSLLYIIIRFLILRYFNSSIEYIYGTNEWRNQIIGYKWIFSSKFYDNIKIISAQRNLNARNNK